MTRVTHVIVGLGMGGAEMVLQRLLAGAGVGLDQRVVSLTTKGTLGERIEELGVAVDELGMSPTTAPAAMPRLVRALRRQAPDVVQTWMYHADLLGGLAARAVGAPVVWGVHQTDLPAQMKWVTRQIASASVPLSRALPERIVCASSASAELHVRRGYPPSKVVVIPYGFDRPHVDRAAARLQLRAELGLPADAALVGRVGRFHPQKDHRSFVEAAAHVARRLPGTRFVLCGPGIDRSNGELVRWLDRAGVAASTHLLGPRTDAGSVQAAFDVAVSSSAFGESLPCVIGESMAAGVPVVTTDVGGSAELIGECGVVVPPNAPMALAEGIVQVLEQPTGVRDALGRRGQSRVLREFPIRAMVDRYGALHREVATTGRPGRRGHPRTGRWVPPG